MQSPHIIFHGDDDDSPMDTPDEREMSLEELGETYARMLGTREVSALTASILPHDSAVQLAVLAGESFAEEAAESDDCPVTPLTIIEAILFVGHPDNQPATPEQIAALMRGVSPEEVDQAVEQLNIIYRADGHAMEIVSSGGGYRLELATDLHSVREALYGKVRDAKLNQAAIDCLSLVAYQPGITREELDRQWHRPSATILSMLVRRSLIELRREGTGKQALIRYYPTDRFLDLFGLASLDELPQVQEFD